MKRYFQYLIITLITLFFFGVGVWLLFKYDVIRFEWSDQLMREIKYNKAKSYTKKVLVLGDSQLEWWPMDHSLYSDMSIYFEDNEIGYVNAAHHGFGPIEYLDQLKHIIKYYKPDILLLFYYAGNDLTNVSYRADDKPLKRTYPVIFESEDKEKLKEKDEESQTFEPFVLKEELFNWDLYKEQGIDPEIIQFAKNRLKFPNKFGREYVNPHLLDLASWKPNSLYDNCTLESVETNYGWYRSLKFFERIMQLADSVSSKVGVIVIPHNVQVDTSQYAFYRKLKFRLDDDLLFSNAPQKILYDFCKASNIAYLDLLPYFKTHNNSGELYLENDEHLSSQGHLLSFEVTRDKMLNKMIADTSVIERKRKMNFYKTFEFSIIENQMEMIKKDSLWYKAVVDKAKLNDLSIENQLRLDAIFIIENYK